MSEGISKGDMCLVFNEMREEAQSEKVVSAHVALADSQITCHRNAVISTLFELEGEPA